MHEVRISENMLSDGISVWVTMRPSGGTPRRILHVKDGYPQWDEADGSSQMPTLTLPDDAGRALLEQLMRHYAGAQDLHTVRADLIHERGRVDRLIGVISDVLGKATRGA